MDYSKDFNQIISDPITLRKILDECSFAGSFAGWEYRKSFISKAINKDGSILDVGCGNGFLLRCLQEWSEYQLIPYGIDNNAQFINGVSDVYPDLLENFAELDRNQIESIANYGLPKEYTFVFFSHIWKDTTETSLEFTLIAKLKELVAKGGRLILGFYNPEKEDNLAAISKLQTFGIEFTTILENPDGTNAIAWVDC